MFAMGHSHCRQGDLLEESDCCQALHLHNQLYVDLATIPHKYMASFSCLKQYSNNLTDKDDGGRHYS